jgi:hypothetical protein
MGAPISPFNEQNVLGVDIFAGDFGDVGDTCWRNKIVTARKAGCCHECKCDVIPGTRIRTITMFWAVDGVMSYRICQECCVAIDQDDGGKAWEARIDIGVARERAWEASQYDAIGKMEEGLL